MRKLLLLGILLPLSLVVQLSWLHPPVPAPLTLVIDAGHGGKDPGTSGLTTKEKNITLAVATKLERLFKASHPEMQVELTRRTDTFVGLVDRANLANRRKANLFVSIHCNANPSKAVVGSETYAMGLHKHEDNLGVMMNENASILLEDNYEEKYDGFDPNSEEAYIIFSLVQNAYLRQSLSLASYIEQSIKTKRPSRGVKQAGFVVLWKTSMPSVLVEIGFLTNPAEEKFLASEEGQQFIAAAIYHAILDYQKQQHG